MYMISDHLTNMLQKDTYNEDMNMYCKAHSAWNSLYMIIELSSSCAWT